MVEITKPNAQKILVPEPRSVVGEGTAWNATVAFQDAVLNPDSEPGDISNALNLVRTTLSREGEDKARAIADYSHCGCICVNCCLAAVGIGLSGELDCF